MYENPNFYIYSWPSPSLLSENVCKAAGLKMDFRHGWRIPNSSKLDMSRVAMLREQKSLVCKNVHSRLDSCRQTKMEYMKS